QRNLTITLLADEVFGAQNFVASVVWQKRTSPDMRLIVSDAHEYVVVYAKDIGNLALNRIPKTPEQIAQYKNPDNDPRGPWISSDYTAQGFRPNQMYKIKTPGGTVYEPPAGVCWKNVELVFRNLVREGRIWFGKDGNAMPRRKTYLNESEGNAPWTWWDNEEVGHTQEAKKEIAELFGDGDAFQTPKPVRLLERIIQLATDDEDLVLDSFAGSGTTGHAALSLNAQDGKSRRFVLVQQPFDNKEDEASKRNISRSVTAERIRLICAGKKSKKKKNGGTKAVIGSFSYAFVGAPLFSEYRDLGKKLPPFEDLAKYIFYTETSREIDLKAVDEKTGFVGSTSVAGGTSYYLLYTPNNREDREVSLAWLDENLKRDKNKTWVIYTERIWLHQEDLRQFEREHGRRVRTMVVPFNLK
ncbi:MAG: hypothetical protein B6D36_16260, partial [Planctomycetes bacterium UTPLA1]